MVFVSVFTSPSLAATSHQLAGRTLQWLAVVNALGCAIIGLYGCCCPACMYGATSEIAGAGDCVPQALLFQFCLPVTVLCCAPGRRGKIRVDLGGLPEEPMSDCLVWCFCASCANCQEARECKASFSSLPALAYAIAWCCRLGGLGPTLSSSMRAQSLLL